jgi:2-dehydro-3-deoxyglucarate aldolase
MSTFTNPLKQRLADAEPLFGLWLSLGSDSAAEALAHAGFDWLLIDMEHAPIDSADVTSLLRAIAAAHLPSEPVVRVPASEGWLVKRVLDAGARTLMFPNIESAEEAAHAVRLTQYPTPDALDGLRGVAGAVHDVEMIAATPGVDCLFIGPADLAASLGHLGDSKHPEVQAAMSHVVAAANKAGIATGIFAMDAAGARQYRDAGFRFIALAADVMWLVRATRQALQEVRS